MYQEYVYLSDAKVRRFIPTATPWWRRMRAKKLAGGAKIGGVEASLELEPSEVARKSELLDRLMDHITLAGRWYTEPDLVPGEWVFFEGRIGYQVTEHDPARGAVLFCEAGEVTGTEPRIVLHGSAQHLVGGAGPVRPPAPANLHHGYSDPQSAGAVVDAAHRSALTLPERTFWRLFDRTPAQAEALPRHLEVLFREIAGTDEYLASAPFLGGCAKVTRVVRSPRLPFPVVVASPLFVRHERP